MKVCYNCTHRAVCGIYDEFLDSVYAVQDYGQLERDFEDRIFLVIAEQCKSYVEQEEEKDDSRV